MPFSITINCLVGASGTNKFGGSIGFCFARRVGIQRNAGKTPNQYNVDLRYSRFFKFKERFRLEFFAEFQNLFNINRIVGFSDVTVTNVKPTTGELIGNLPDFKTRNLSIAQESR